MRTKTLSASRAFAAALALLAISATASATTLVNINPGGWSEAMKQGNVQAGPAELSKASQEFYQSQIGVDMFGAGPIKEVRAVRPTLTPDVRVGNPGPKPNANGEDAVFEALVMAWEAANNEDPGILNVAQWDYHVNVQNGDAQVAQAQRSFDLSKGHLKFSIRAPRRIWDVSLELFDINGNSIGWFGQPPGPDWTNQVIWLGVGAPQGIFTTFIGNAAFDPTQVVLIRLNESTQGGAMGDFEVNPATGLPGVWNAWNHFKVVVPEPGSLALLCLGVLAMGRRLAQRRPD